MPQPLMAKHKGKAVSRACFCNASKNKTNSRQGKALKGRAADNSGFAKAGVQVFVGQFFAYLKCGFQIKGSA
jgi:hypothetical protein